MQHDLHLRPSKDNQLRPAPLLFVDGAHDIHFLKVISHRLAEADPALPDLEAEDRLGRIIFIPRGGSDHQLWTNRLTGLGLPEIHFFDRDGPD